ncbi:hypothetical protein [Leucobacter chromiiresistens]|nr:hypothetical protein [Leucobacter chromiiresistens]
MPTQTQARDDLQLGAAAWQSGKRKLLEAGFLIEVRDRYPRGYVDAAGRPRGGQRRFRLFMQDPDPDYVADAAEALIELEEPYEEYLAAAENNQYGLSALAGRTPGQPDSGFSALASSPSADNPHTVENPQSFKEEKTKTDWLVGSQDFNEPTNLPTREAGIDAELEALAPGCGLTLAAIEREVSGRVDLEGVDVVQAARDTLLRASSRVNKPASYIAAVIVRHPEKWPIGGDAPVPFDPAPAREASFSESSVAACLRGEHWWGSERLPEIDRSHCVECAEPRRNVDPVFAELEREMLSIGGAD